ncbi:hypothetical protein EQP59_02150 [Ornithobacterium rhinotracheale]|uniref:Type VI secretion system baseplate subunit TssK n=1 Tax=Ornithobacterium rhinotracheale TaxID=28251 RepID=A0A410JQ35_ORNRH|nr:hypothetical protein [Ornithobacterium rhinotracheale]QAR30242.1 hypothetical protein EQP59_02150 [Ornithobacterium rhinotracheale]
MNTSIKHYPVHWTDGMKINKSHFVEMQNFISESVIDSTGVHTSMINYGLLPMTNSLKMNLVIDSHKLLRVKVEQCQAITPNGTRICIDESSQSLKVSLAYPEVVKELREGEEATLMACISVNPYDRIPCGEPDPEEMPPRYPYTQPQYSLLLINEKELQQSFSLGNNYLTIGKILVSNAQSRIDEAYIPPCVSVSSHPKLTDLYNEIDRFYGQMELYGVQIEQKIHSKKQSGILVEMMEALTDKLLNYLGSEINRFRCLSPYMPPVHMLLSVISLARILKNFTDTRSGVGKEELLNYFAQWCNVTQGEFESLFTQVINVDYDHNQMDATIFRIKNFMRTLEELFSMLSRLDYIGKKKDGSIFVSEVTDENEAVIQPKRSRTFLAD